MLELGDLLIAHSSHWLVNLAYMGPVLAFLIWLGLTTLKERRNERADGSNEARSEKTRPRP